MGKPITATIPHTLGKDEARRRIAAGFSTAQRNRTGLGALFSLQEHWEGDRLHFDASGIGQRIFGWLDVLPDRVEIQVNVPDLLAAVAERLLGSLTVRAQKFLGDQSGRG